MSTPDREAVEMFLQEASEHLQYLREYVSVLQELSPAGKISSASIFQRIRSAAPRPVTVFRDSLKSPQNLRISSSTRSTLRLVKTCTVR